MPHAESGRIKLKRNRRFTVGNLRLMDSSTLPLHHASEKWFQIS